MLEQIIEQIIQNIRKEIIQLNMSELPLNYIFTRKIPDSVKHFLDQEVESWIRQERGKFNTGERFDYEIPEVQMLVDQIFDILKQSAQFPINQFNRLSERAVKLEASYLIRPEQTLTQFLFKDNFVITTIEVYDMLKYFNKFPHYKDALSNFFNMKYLKEISQTQFEELIQKIDHQFFSKKQIERLLETIKIINDFLNQGRSTPSEMISTRLLSTILRDRNLADSLLLVERISQEGINEISISDLEPVLRTGKTPKELQEYLVQNEYHFDTISSEDSATEITQDEYDSIQEEFITSPQQTFNMMKEQKIFEDYNHQPEIEEIPSANSNLESNGPNDQENQSKEEEQPLQEDINLLMTPRQRKRFIKKIFKKQENQYQEIIQLLNDTPTWKSASNLIDNFFYKQGINPYSKPAMEFSDLIHGHYFSKNASAND